MKKYIFYTLATVATLLTFSCSKEAEVQNSDKPVPVDPVVPTEKTVVIGGNMGDPGTKVSSDNNGIYKWQDDDIITILTASGANREFTAKEAGISTDFSGHIPSSDEIDGSFALYPASENHERANEIVSFVIDSEQIWNADASNMPMFATITIEDEKPTASFKAVGGTLKLILYNIPSGAAKLTFTAASKQICGEFLFDSSALEPVIEGGDTDNAEEKTISFNFSGNYSSNKVFYIPLPVVTLTGGFTIAILDSDNIELFSVTSTMALPVGRNQLIIAKTLNCASSQTLWSEDFSQYSADDVPGATDGEVYHGATGYACVNGNNDTKIYAANLAGGSSPELLINQQGGSFTVSGINCAGVTKMTLTFTKNNNALTVTATSGISISGSTSGTGTKTLTLANNSLSSFDLTFSAGSNNVRIDNIVLSGPAPATVPTISANKSEFNFAVGQSSATATVSLANAVDDLGISAIVSGTDASNFTAAIDGSTLTITAKAPNTTVTDKVATVTLKATGASKAISITQASCLVPNPTDLAAESGDATVDVTWTGDAHATSYVAYLHTAETATPASGGTNISSSISHDGLNYIIDDYTSLVNGTTYYLYVKVNGVSANYAAPEDYVMVSFKPVANKTLESIAVTTMPTKTMYNVGDTFDFTGAVVTAYYSDDTNAEVTASCSTDYDGVTFDATGVKTVTVSYTDSVTRTTTFNVTVAMVDVLTYSVLSSGMSGNNGYKAFSGISGSSSSAEYSGQINYTSTLSYIQIRNQSPSGIVSTTSGGLVKKVSVSYAGTNTVNRTLTVYGKNTAYSEPADLYDDGKKGTQLGTIVFTQNATSGYVDISGDYEYVGLLSSGAMYFAEIDIVWAPGSPTISMAKTSISGVAAAGVNNASESSVYTFKNGATDADVTVTCDGEIVTSASKNNGSLTYSVAANTGAAREGWIKVQYGSESAHTVTVSQNAATYTLTLSSGGNGTVAATVDDAAVASGSAVAVGKTVSITTTPSSGYLLASLSYNDGSAHDIISTKSFTMPSAAVTVSATFSAVPTIGINKSSITDVAAAGVTNASESGVYSFYNGATDAAVTVTCDGTIVTAASKNNGALTYTVASNSGAARDGWIKVQYSTEDPHQITVSQVAATYVLTLSATNGSVSASVGGVAKASGSAIEVGATVSITATPSSGYTFSAWDVYQTSSSSTKVSTAADTSPTTFTMPAYAVTASATFAASGTTWTRVTSVATLTAGGTFIIGYEATANSGIIVPMRTEGTATTSATGIAYSGTTSGSSTNGTIDMSTVTTTSDYEISIESGTADGTIAIKIGSNYVIVSGTDNKHKLSSSKVAAGDYTPTMGTNNVFTLTAKTKVTIKKVDYYPLFRFNNNANQYRFTNYAKGGQQGFVFYKKN